MTYCFQIRSRISTKNTGKCSMKHLELVYKCPDTQTISRSDRKLLRVELIQDSWSPLLLHFSRSLRYNAIHSMNRSTHFIPNCFIYHSLSKHCTLAFKCSGDADYLDLIEWKDWKYQEVKIQIIWGNSERIALSAIM